MYTPSLLLTLAAAVTAVDIRLYISRDCSGMISLYCINAPPDRCCGGPNPIYGSVEWAPVPAEWYVWYRAHGPQYCDTVRAETRRSGITRECIGNGGFSGGGYSTLPKKRETSGEAAEGCSKPDFLTMGETDVAVGHLSEGQQQEIIKLAVDGAELEVVQTKINSFAAV